MDRQLINGFSRLSRDEKLSCIATIINDPLFIPEAASYRHPQIQEVFDSFSENTLSNYYLPFGVAPNFIINGKVYHIPMVTEESSVVAAASWAAKFWSTRGGFNARVISTVKKGHVHFLWMAGKEILTLAFPEIKERLLTDTVSVTANMQKRGGGIVEIKLEDCSAQLDGYFRISVDFETADSMGANFINSCLEIMSDSFKLYVAEKMPEQEGKLEIIMSILSNYTPECLVECSVSCPAEQLDKIDGETSWHDFVHKFKTAVDIANLDPYRAATHNKGIMNGIDAVVIATGNDFRAVEAGAHSYASATGSYKSLSHVEIAGSSFLFTLKIPLAIGTVGGLTSLHPLAKRSMQLLGNPSAKELMMIIASAGLANNFSAVKALVTKGIQRGHMKMHLSNMLLPYKLNKDQKMQAEEYFRTRNITYADVREYVTKEFGMNNI